ncbi:hypothetical protein V6C27_13785 [Peptococcaceae bacterium 1198_IL3148]
MYFLKLIIIDLILIMAFLWRKKFLNHAYNAVNFRAGNVQNERTGSIQQGFKNLARNKVLDNARRKGGVIGKAANMADSLRQAWLNERVVWVRNRDYNTKPKYKKFEAKNSKDGNKNKKDINNAQATPSVNKEKTDNKPAKYTIKSGFNRQTKDIDNNIKEKNEPEIKDGTPANQWLPSEAQDVEKSISLQVEPSEKTRISLDKSNSRHVADNGIKRKKVTLVRKSKTNGVQEQTINTNHTPKSDINKTKDVSTMSSKVKDVKEQKLNTKRTPKSDINKTKDATVMPSKVKGKKLNVTSQTPKELPKQKRGRKINENINPRVTTEIPKRDGE